MPTMGRCQRQLSAGGAGRREAALVPAGRTSDTSLGDLPGQRALAWVHPLLDWPSPPSPVLLPPDAHVSRKVQELVLQGRLTPHQASHILELRAQLRRRRRPWYIRWLSHLRDWTP